MTDTVKEQLSAFLDGELPEAETTLLLKRLERDDELRGTLSRYSLIGAVMRTAGDVPAARHVASRVSAALALEPALGAAARGSRWLRPVGGLAVAATVALAAVLLLPQSPGQPGGEGVPQVASLQSPATVTVPASAGAARAAVPVVMVAADDEPVAYTTPPAAVAPAGALPSAQLAAYLVAHSEYTSPLSRRSVVTTLPDEATDGNGTDDAGTGR
jgi:sigma-E factor negative regulatory protein RseA